MNKGDCVKVHTQIGLMKKPRWIVAEVVEGNFPETGILVMIHGNLVWCDQSKVRRYERLVYEKETGTCPEVENFQNNNWERIKTLINGGVKKFFPNVDYEFDEDEKTVYAMNRTISMAVEVRERETISSFIEYPVWVVQAWYTIHATRYEPSEVDSTEISNATNPVGAAKAFIDAIWSINQDEYWDNYQMEEVPY